MESDTQVSQLEQALQQQAGTLARELLQNAESARARMLAESAEKLKLAGEHEVLGAKVEAERLVRRQGQAAETRLAAELDRLRWALTESALAEVRIAFRHPGTAGRQSRPIRPDGRSPPRAPGRRTGTRDDGTPVRQRA